MRKNHAIATMATSATPDKGHAHLTAHWACTSTSVSGSAPAGSLFTTAAPMEKPLTSSCEPSGLRVSLADVKLDPGEGRDELQADDQPRDVFEAVRLAR